jgi:hypothetical protein
MFCYVLNYVFVGSVSVPLKSSFISQFQIQDPGSFFLNLFYTVLYVLATLVALRITENKGYSDLLKPWCNGGLNPGVITWHSVYKITIPCRYI